MDESFRGYQMDETNFIPASFEGLWIKIDRILGWKYQMQPGIYAFLQLETWYYVILKNGFK